MTRALLAIILCAGAARAGLIQTTSLANEDWGDCSASLSQISETSAYVTLSSSCGYPDISGYSSATVSQGPVLAAFSESGGIVTSQSGSVPGGGASDPQGSVTADGGDTQTLMATGSTGSGILLLQFELNGESENDAGTGGGGGVDYSFTVTGGNGSFCPAVSIGEFACGDGYSVFAVVPFVFGTPFSVSEDLSVIAESSDAGMASFDVQSALYGYALETPSGSPIAGATLVSLVTDSDGSMAPEPPTLSSAFLLLAALSGLKLLQMRRAAAMNRSAV